MAATKSGSSQMYTNTRKMYAQLSCTYVCTVKHACTHARTGIGLVKAGECDGSREGKPTTQASVTEARPGIPARWNPANCPLVNAGTFCPIRQSFLALLASTNHSPMTHGGLEGRERFQVVKMKEACGIGCNKSNSGDIVGLI